MKARIILSLLMLSGVLSASNSLSFLDRSILTIGIFDHSSCGVITEHSRSSFDDREVAEAVMDKTGISELGTGFVYEVNGEKYVITCEHVLFKAGRIVGFDAQFSKYELELVGSDMQYDIVVLKFRDKNIANKFNGLKLAQTFSQEEEAIISHIGFWTSAGNQNIKEGKILCKTNDLQSLHIANMGYFESSAYIPGGYSGGPVLNQEGELIGMNTARNKQGTSYALNVTILKNLIGDIIVNRKVNRVFTGIEFAQETNTGEIFINSIIEDSPASKISSELLGVALANINEQPVSNIYSVFHIMENIKPSEPISITLANGKKLSIDSERLDAENLAKIANHALSQYLYPEMKRLELEDDLTVVIENGQKHVIKTAGLGGNKIYCLNNQAQLGIIIRMYSLYGLIEIGKDDAHVYIDEIKFSKENNKRILYY